MLQACLCNPIVEARPQAEHSYDSNITIQFLDPTNHTRACVDAYSTLYLLRTTLMEARHTVVCVVYIFSPVASVLILDLIFTFLSYVYS